MHGPDLIWSPLGAAEIVCDVLYSTSVSELYTFRKWKVNTGRFSASRDVDASPIGEACAERD